MNSLFQAVNNQINFVSIYFRTGQSHKKKAPQMECLFKNVISNISSEDS